jgi:hypothetical protein
LLFFSVPIRTQKDKIVDGSASQAGLRLGTDCFVFFAFFCDPKGGTAVVPLGLGLPCPSYLSLKESLKRGVMWAAKVSGRMRGRSGPI